MKITIALIIACIVVFALIGSYSSYKQNEIFEKFGFSGKNLQEGRLWTPITSIFLHGSLTHLIFNVVALFFFGKSLENNIRPYKYLLVFFSGGIVGNLVSLAFYPSSELFVGASGAIFAVMGMVMLADPFELSFYPYIIPVPIALVGVVYTIYTMFAFLFGGDPNVAYTAHLGGLVVGILFGLRNTSIKGILSVIALFIILLALPVIFNFLGMFDYSGLISALF